MVFADVSPEALAALGPIVGLRPRVAISGFANPATITTVAMYMLSVGIQNTGLVQQLGVYLADFTHVPRRATCRI